MGTVEGVGVGDGGDGAGSVGAGDGVGSVVASPVDAGDDVRAVGVGVGVRDVGAGDDAVAVTTGAELSSCFLLRLDCRCFNSRRLSNELNFLLRFSASIKPFAMSLPISVSVLIT